MAKFELGSVLAEALGNVSKSGTEQIEYLPLENLVCDERNFYSMEGVDELAANIELVGLQQPLRVIAGEPPYYVIISGHRRRAALRILAEENPERWKTVPCIVETASGSPELQELRLIMANADTRKMSSADLAKQAERVQELLYKLKEQGVEFPGRMRDHVAEACKVSKTKLAELKVIREKLTNPEIRAYWESGKLNHASAYLIAKADELTQRQLCTYIGANRLPGAGAWWIEGKLKTLEKMTNRRCPSTGDICSNSALMIDKKFRNESSYCACEYYCCAECPALVKCKSVCTYCAEAQAGLKEERRQREAEEQKRNAEREAERKAEREKEIKEGGAVWSRFDRAAKAAGVAPQELIAILNCREPENVDDGELAEYQDRVAGRFRDKGDFTASELSDSPLWDLEDPEDYAATAELLKCSVDYLLGMTDDLTPVGGGWVSVEDRYPPEGTYCLAFDKRDVPMPSVYFRAAFMEIESKNVATRRLKDIEYWMPLPAPPTGKLWISENVIREMVEGRK